jgi:NhaP-type Na+/H+ and K+/H+ antiporter
MSHDTFAATLALIGLVILVSSLLSGAVERTGLPQVAIFLVLGAMLGPAGLGLVDLGSNQALQVIATLGLVWCSSATRSGWTSASCGRSGGSPSPFSAPGR